MQAEEKDAQAVVAHDDPVTPPRMPRSVRGLGVTGAAAIAVMALAPQIGGLLPHGGFSDAILPGTDGTAHFQSPETTRGVDAQLLSLTPGAAGITAAPGTRLLTVRLRLAAARAGDAAGCHVELWDAKGALDQHVVGSSRCGDGMVGDGSRETVSTLVVAVPQDARPTQVRVMWDPPAYLQLPAV